jgi:hypothetical protein
MIAEESQHLVAGHAAAGGNPVATIFVHDQFTGEFQLLHLVMAELRLQPRDSGVIAGVEKQDGGITGTKV